MAKTFLIGLALVAALAAGGWRFWMKDQVAYARVATAYGAKQVCSCRFISAREIDSCLGDFTQDISLVSFSEEGQEITASVLGGLVRATAAYEDGLGCALAAP